jgi:hypothetical protein
MGKQEEIFQGPENRAEDHHRNTAEENAKEFSPVCRGKNMAQSRHG